MSGRSHRQQWRRLVIDIGVADLTISSPWHSSHCHPVRIRSEIQEILDAPEAFKVAVETGALTGFKASGMLARLLGLHFDNSWSTSVFLLLPIFSLKSKIFSSLIALGRLEPRPPMPLSLHIAQGNARRVAGRNRPAKLPARIRVLRPHFGLGLLPEHGARVDQYMKSASGDASPSPAA